MLSHITLIGAILVFTIRIECIRSPISVKKGEMESLELVNMTLILNKTGFTPGDAICPKSNLTSPFKKKTVYIGIVGCNIAPLVPLLMQEDIQIHAHCGMEDYGDCSLPGN